METSGEKLYVIVPCFNEEQNIEMTVRSILRHADTLPVPVRVIMVDDGSTDGTFSKMQELERLNSRCQAVTNGGNLGVGRSVVRCYETIPDGSWITAVPGDNEFLFESINRFLVVRQDYDLILGYLQNQVIRTFPRRLASWLFMKVVSTLYGFPWRYLNGMKMYRVEVFRGISVVSAGHAFTAELIAKAQLRNPGLRIGEVPFMARGRAIGQSKAFRLSSILRAVREVWAGARSVARYREEVVRGPGWDAPS